MGITAKDIAKEAGVSVATVSMVLNKKDERISEKTRQRILDIADKHCFTCNPIAVSLATQKTFTIGLILPKFCWIASAIRRPHLKIIFLHLS